MRQIICFAFGLVLLAGAVAAQDKQQRDATAPSPAPKNATTEEKKALTNADVLSMVKAGLAESTIVLSFQQAVTNFDTTPNALIILKKQGVSAKILDAMLSAKEVVPPLVES
jgi:hypothetical protein